MNKPKDCPLCGMPVEGTVSDMDTFHYAECGTYFAEDMVLIEQDKACKEIQRLKGLLDEKN